MKLYSGTVQKVIQQVNNICILNAITYAGLRRNPSKTVPMDQ